MAEEKLDVFEADVSDEERARILAEMAGVSIEEARLMIAIERGEVEGDVVALEDGEE